jgi:hypothetical protein
MPRQRHGEPVLVRDSGDSGQCGGAAEGWGVGTGGVCGRVFGGESAVYGGLFDAEKCWGECGEEWTLGGGDKDVLEGDCEGGEGAGA